ncbi:putative DNA alkylation repair enzyme [Sporocytophaga myxococcoides]|uniref:Putative DNA alkylation repair enzyme n=1 Tax=Sporocytophaga myxococcoides TaxID=153721 RepID=A0A098LDE0_9BACT|nr:DNA alkylation repair protein [Sporocytophaga myxococcoides]GAL84444.1 putative DNA alkylation repair enzyme [Sporocytophaga myxococcoides]
MEKAESELEKIVSQLKSQARPEILPSLSKFGVNTEKAFGISIPVLRNMAKVHRKDHLLAIELWKTDIHEARILASMIDDPAKVQEKQMDWWVNDFNSWDLCDQVCLNLFRKTPFAFEKAKAWTEEEDEFVRRAGFVLIATLAVHDKKGKDERFSALFSLIEKHSNDERNFVKKAVNWALRQIGKRNEKLHQEAIILAERIISQDSKSSKWIANNALVELKSKKVVDRIQKKK